MSRMIWIVVAEDGRSKVEVLMSSERAARALVNKLRPRYGDDADCYEAPIYGTAKEAVETLAWILDR